MLRWLAFLLLTALIGTVALSLVVRLNVAERIYDKPEAIPQQGKPRIAIVFGAGLWPNGAATPILYDRVATAAELYRLGRVKTLLLTGDNRTPQHNEPLAMQQVALSLGLPRTALVLDDAGTRTYDSCYRAREVFAVKRAIVVTQRFHLDRALYTCTSLGIDSLAIVADRRNYGGNNYTYWTLREYPSLVQAFLDLSVLHPEVVLGDRQPIQ